ncbi:MAG TPA: hypothetical protein VIJ51_03335 [Solirubrobacteraceae bacterium]
MDRFVSQSIALTPGQTQRRFSRADLVFFDVDARGASFAGRVFLDPPGADPDTSPTREDGYAGFFFILGHGGCFGDDGHCEVPVTRDPFDIDPPHALTPQVKLVDVTSRLVAMTSDAIVVTVLAVSRSAGGPILVDALQFSGFQLLSYD